jgi:hypothetical protein
MAAWGGLPALGWLAAGVVGIGLGVQLLGVVVEELRRRPESPVSRHAAACARRARAELRFAGRAAALFLRGAASELASRGRLVSLALSRRSRLRALGQAVYERDEHRAAEHLAALRALDARGARVAQWRADARARTARSIRAALARRRAAPGGVPESSPADGATS